MLKFTWNRKDNRNVPVLSAKDMDMLAEALIKDYNPSLIEKPQPINFEHFLEIYLGVSLEYQDLRAENPNEKILGVTPFDADFAIVYDHERQRAKKIKVYEGSVLLQQDLLTPAMQGRLRFTALHEASHWWCHKDYFSSNDCFNNDKTVKIAACKSRSIENFAYRKCTTPDDWLEYQADYMASAIAMPMTPFIKTARAILKDVGIAEKKIEIGLDSDNDWFAKSEFPSIIAETFGVSKKAAAIKLSNFGFVVNKKII